MKKIYLSKAIIMLLNIVIFGVVSGVVSLEENNMLFNSPYEVEFELSIPKDYKTVEDDTYLCTTLEMSPEYTYYITDFVPHANGSIQHHLALHACAVPGMTNARVWRCFGRGNLPSVPEGPICDTRKEDWPIYAWALDAPSLKLPKGVAFKVGKDTPFRYLILQMHFRVSTIKLGKSLKTSGLTISAQTTKTGITNQAGTYLIYITEGYTPARSITYLEIACRYNGAVDFHPFRYRVHGHSRGRLNSVYLVRNGVWTEIGKKNPLLPEYFYPVSTATKDDISGVTIKKNDVIALRCTLENNDNFESHIGKTAKSDMCNAFMMFYLNEGQEMPENYHDFYCYRSAEQPKMKWSENPLLSGSPPEDVSTDPDSGKVW